MDNLRAYAEDDSASSPSTGQLAKRPPPSSEGLSTSSSSRTSSMAVSTTHVTSGPDPAVLAPTTSNPTVIQDKTVALEDIPPPPPAEPYEQFLARVSRELATLPGGPPWPAAAAPPQPAVPIPTTGSRLPMPFPRYEDSSWASQQQAQMVRIRMPLPASCYAPPPSPWTGPRCACATGPWPSASQVHAGTYKPFGTCSTPYRTYHCRTNASSSSSIIFPESEKHFFSPPPPPTHTHTRFRGFFRVPRPLLSRWRWRPVRTLRLLRSCPKTLGKFSKVLRRRWFEAGKLSGSRIWNSTGNNYKVTLHLSRLRVPLYPKGIWAPTHCGSWVPRPTGSA